MKTRNERRYNFQRWLTCLCALMLAFAALPVAAQGEPVGTPGIGSQLEACALVEEGALADELNILTQGVLGQALDEIDIDAIVAQQWALLGIDQVVATEVDAAVARVKGDTDYWNTFLSGWSGDKARALTLEVANQAFGSEGFRKAIEDLTSGVAVAIGTQVSVLSAEGASSAANCLQTFIRGNYAPVLVEVFQKEVEQAAGEPGLDEAELPSTLLMALDQHRLALGGVGVIIATQIAKALLQRLAKQVAQRVAGKITARLLGSLGSTVIPLAGWIIGGGMIAYDIWSGRDGALPQIQEQLQSEEVMASIREEIADAIEPELRTEIPGVARDLANGLYAQWAEVRQDLRVILELAGEDETFAAMLGGLQNEEELQGFVALTRALLNVESIGRAGVLEAAQNGDLTRALPVGETIAPVVAATGSLQSALAWSFSAGDLLDDVVALEIYKVKQPDELTRAQLQKLIALDSMEAVAKLGRLPIPELNALLDLSTVTLGQLADTLSSENLLWLAQAIQGRSQDEVNQLVSSLASDPQLVQVIQERDLLQALPANADLNEAVAFIATGDDPIIMANDAMAVLTGAPTWSLFSLKYGWVTTLGVMAGLVLLVLLVLRLLWAMGVWLLHPMLALGTLGGGRSRAPDATRGSLTDNERARLYELEREKAERERRLDQELEELRRKVREAEKKDDEGPY